MNWSYFESRNAFMWFEMKFGCVRNYAGYCVLLVLVLDMACYVILLTTCDTWIWYFELKMLVNWKMNVCHASIDYLCRCEWVNLMVYCVWFAGFAWLDMKIWSRYEIKAWTKGQVMTHHTSHDKAWRSRWGGLCKKKNHGA